MNTFLRTLGLGVLGLGVCLSLGSAGPAQQPPPPPQPDVSSGTTATDETALQAQGVEVQTRGPINEAFAEPAIRGPRPSPIVTKQPPDPITELPPDQRPEGNNVEWIPGYWAWDDDSQNFLWVSGAWRAVPPGREWIPGYWSQVQGGWQWVAGYWQDQSQDVALLPQPPDPIQEAVPPAPSPTDIWVPGCWVYNQTQYDWRPGFWTAFQPDWVWVPASYIWTPGGYIFVDGHWDFPLQTRGLLFAPVVFTQPVYLQPNWVYRPTFAVYEQSLLDSLFVRLTNHHYYFGDYFGPQYQKLGFRDWYDYSVTRHFHDPLFAYYRVAHRNQPNWERSLRDVYVARRENPAVRPPRTLIQQSKVVRNVRNKTEINRLTMVAPLTRFRQTAQIKLQPVTETRLTEARKTVQQFHELSRQRAEVTRQVVARGGVAARPGERAAPVKLNLNRVQTPATRSVATKAPERPRHPALENRPVPRVENRPGERPGEVRPGEERRPVARPGESRPPEERRPAVRPEERRPGGVPEVRPMPRPGEERRPPARPEERRPAATPQPRPGTEHPQQQPAPERRPEPNRPPNAARPPAVKPEARPAAKPEEHRPAPAAEPRPMPPRPAQAPDHRPAPAPEHRPAPAQPPAAQHQPAPPAAEHRPAPAPERRPAPAQPPAAQHQPAPPAQHPAAKPAENRPQPAPARPPQPEHRPAPPQAEHRPAPPPAARPAENHPQPPPARPAPPQAENHPAPHPAEAKPAPAAHQPAPAAKPAPSKEPHEKKKPPDK